MDSDRITKDFTFSEFEKSATAKNAGIDNSIPMTVQVGDQAAYHDGASASQECSMQTIEDKQRLQVSGAEQARGRRAGLPACQGRGRRHRSCRSAVSCTACSQEQSSFRPDDPLL